MPKTGGTKCQVVSTGVGGGFSETGGAPEKDIITDNEQKRGEGTALFNPPRDGDLVILGPAESGPDPDTVEQAFDQTEEPVRHPDPANGFKNKGVIDRVEGFGRVHEENEKIPISKKRIQGFVHP